ncbi:MAG: hypothetical protein ACXV8O_04935 [Methylobacter sp.]
MTEAMRAVLEESELVTKKDLQLELAPIKDDLNLLKWMIGGFYLYRISPSNSYESRWAGMGMASTHIFNLSKNQRSLTAETQAG